MTKKSIYKNPQIRRLQQMRGLLFFFLWYFMRFAENDNATKDTLQLNSFSSSLGSGEYIQTSVVSTQ